MTGYFGEAKFKKPDEIHIPTPVGLICQWCKEAVQEGDTGTMAGGLVMHDECSLRGVAGSVGHQKGLCSCYGGTEEDPEGMTTRQAAVAAARYWYLSQGKKLFG